MSQSLPLGGGRPVPVIRRARPLRSLRGCASSPARRLRMRRGTRRCFRLCGGLRHGRSPSPCRPDWLVVLLRVGIVRGTGLARWALRDFAFPARWRRDGGEGRGSYLTARGPPGRPLPGLDPCRPAQRAPGHSSERARDAPFSAARPRASAWPRRSPESVRRHARARSASTGSRRAVGAGRDPRPRSQRRGRAAARPPRPTGSKSHAQGQGCAAARSVRVHRRRPRRRGAPCASSLARSRTANSIPSQAIDHGEVRLPVTGQGPTSASGVGSPTPSDTAAAAVAAEPSSLRSSARGGP